MPINFPVPMYLSATQLSGSRYRLQTASPGTTDSTATGKGFGFGTVGRYFAPEIFLDGTDEGGPNAVGTANGERGWAHDIRTDIAEATAAFTIAAGTWTIVIHYSRPGGLLTADIDCTFTAVLFRAKSDFSSFPQEIGRVTGARVTCTTTEQTQTLNISGAQATFEPGEIIWLEIHASSPGALIGDRQTLRTNSTTATRITAVPAYTIRRDGVGASSGVGAASGVFAARKEAVGSASGAASTEASLSAFKGLVGVSDGVAQASASAASVQPTIGSSDGTSFADAIGAAIAQSIASGAGAATADAVASAIAQTVGGSAGEAAAEGFMGAVVGTVGVSDGLAEADGETALVVGTVGTVNVSEGGGTTIRKSPIYIFPEED